MLMKTALDLSPGEEGEVIQFMDENLACQLITFGVLPNTTLVMVRRSPFGSSIYFRIGDFNLALRKSEASKIVIR